MDLINYERFSFLRLSFVVYEAILKASTIIAFFSEFLISKHKLTDPRKRVKENLAQKH